MAITQVSNSLVKQDLTISGGTVDNTVIGSGTPAAGTFTTIAGTLASAVAATTQAASDNSTKVATTAYVTTALANLVDSAPGTLNTLNELAAALGDDASFSTTVTNSIATKLPLAGGTMTGDLILGDNVKLEIGSASGGDLQIFHDGSNSFISDQGTGHLKLLAGDFRLNNAADNAQMISAVSGGAVFLYHNNSIKLTTTSTGINITGEATITGQNTSHGASRIKVSQESSAISQIRFYGANTSTPGILQFTGSSSDGSAGAERMRIDASGNLGIGGSYTTPKEKLHVVGAAVFDGNHATATNAFRADEGVLIHGAGNVGYITAVSNGNNDVDLQLRALNGGSANTNQLVLDSEGLVGIGRAPAFSQLEIQGNKTLANNLHIQMNGASNTNKQMILGYDTDQDKSYIISQVAGSASKPLVLTASLVGIGTGTTTPKGLLHVKEADSGMGSANGNFDKLVLEDNSHSGMTILGGANTHGAIYFGDPDTNDVGQIKYKHNEDSLDFTTNSQERMTILSSGVVDFMFGTHTNPDSAGRHVYTKFNRTSGYDGHVVFYQSGTPQWQQSTDSLHNLRFYSYQNGAGHQFSLLSSGGIAFGTDTAQANALDDYEEGTWTPVLISGGSTNPSGGGALAPSGVYQKIGNRVTVTFYVGRSFTNSPNGTIMVQGLPYTIASGSSSPNYYIPCVTYRITFGNSHIPFIIPTDGGNTFALYAATSGSTWSALTWQSHAASSAGIYISGTFSYVV